MNHASREEMLAAFGPFRVVFEPIGDDRNPYLALLGLHDPLSLDVVRTIRDTVAATDTTPFALTLLRDVNWRPHLVGAIATHYNTSEAAIAQMWAALDAGSWVTPQLAGILSKRDAGSVDNAVARLANCCTLSGDPAYSIESPIERHSAQGPAGSSHRSSKAAASLFALLPANHATQFSSNDDLQSLIAGDYDGSAEIATSWLSKYLELDAQL